MALGRVQCAEFYLALSSASCYLFWNCQPGTTGYNIPEAFKMMVACLSRFCGE